jgi:hypothetical protein
MSGYSLLGTSASLRQGTSATLRQARCVASGPRQSGSWLVTLLGSSRSYTGGDEAGETGTGAAGERAAGGEAEAQAALPTGPQQPTS